VGRLTAHCARNLAARDAEMLGAVLPLQASPQASSPEQTKAFIEDFK
jgi:hypothetical protein